MKINIISSSLRSTGFCIALACLLAMPACSQTTTPVAVPMSEAGDLLQDVHHTFNIEIREDGSVWYQPIAPEIRTIPLQASEPVADHLKTAIASFEKMYPGIKKAYIIKGKNEGNDSQFQSIIQALKSNKIYKYHLETPTKQ